MDMITVKTRKTETICPKEENPRDYITNTPVEVPDTAYYRRLVYEGSLELAAEDQKDKPASDRREKGRAK